MHSPLLRLENIHKNFGNLEVLKGIDLTLEKGKKVAVIGPSGCGKTTLLLAIAGFQDPQQGEIILNDTVIASTSISTPPEKRRVGMVFQDHAKLLQ